MQSRSTSKLATPLDQDPQPYLPDYHVESDVFECVNALSGGERRHRRGPRLGADRKPRAAGETPDASGC